MRNASAGMPARSASAKSAWVISASAQPLTPLSSRSARCRWPTCKSASARALAGSPASRATNAGFRSWA